MRPKASSCPVTPPHLSRCWTPWESYSGSKAVRTPAHHGDCGHLVSKELDWEEAPTRWGPGFPACASAQRARGPDPAPFGLLPLTERICLCRERPWSFAQSHSADLLWGLHTGLWAGSWLGEAGGLGARRRGHDRRCRRGPEPRFGGLCLPGRLGVVVGLSLRLLKADEAGLCWVCGKNCE